MSYFNSSLPGCQRKKSSEVVLVTRLSQCESKDSIPKKNQHVSMQGRIEGGGKREKTRESLLINTRSFAYAILKKVETKKMIFD